MGSLEVECPQASVDGLDPFPTQGGPADCLLTPGTWFSAVAIACSAVAVCSFPWLVGDDELGAVVALEAAVWLG